MEPPPGGAYGDEGRGANAGSAAMMIPRTGVVRRRSSGDDALMRPVIKRTLPRASQNSLSPKPRLGVSEQIPDAEAHTPRELTTTMICRVSAAGGLALTTRHNGDRDPDSVCSMSSHM